MVNMKNRAGSVDSWFYEEVIADGATGNDVKINPLTAGKLITCTIIAGASTGKFQITTSSDAKVAADTATWQDWAEGNSTGTVSDVLAGPVTGIRGVSVSGEITVEIVI